tara:strand:- start:32997 stop:33431 length:435 start_codon:yes stop_codon:yes gene_type:complete
MFFKIFKMNYKYLLLLLFFGLLSIQANAQVCILAIGSENSANIIDVFQLNEDQKSAFEIFKNELKTELDIQQKQIKELLENHPQSNPDELIVLAKKHKALEENMFETTIKYDQKLISLFNEKQYERYVLLCETANRTPILIVKE